MNAIGVKSGSLIIPFNDTDIELGGYIYRNLIVIARMLNSVELQRILMMDLERGYIREELYEDIFRECYISIPGIVGDINFDEAPAGFITTVASVILSKSLEYSTDPQKAFERDRESVTLLDQMAAIVSRYMNTPYLEVVELPVNKLFELYAICHATYPEHVKEIVIEEPQNNIPPV